MATNLANSEYPPITADESERPAFAQLEAALQSGSDRTAPSTPTLVGPHGEPIALPKSVAAVLRQAVATLAHDQAVSVLPMTTSVTPQEAADLLNVAPAYLLTLLDEGAISSHGVGADRRIPLTSLLSYKRQRDQAREQTLDHLAARNQELGLY